MMDPATIARLESSFNMLAPRADELVEVFYQRLFDARPQFRALFPADLSAQKKKLLASIGLVLRNLHRPDKLHEPLLEMGIRHAVYRAKPDDYPVMRDTLIGTMSALAGKQWNAQLTEDWRHALDLVVSGMIEGHATVAVLNSE